MSHQFALLRFLPASSLHKRFRYAHDAVAELETETRAFIGLCIHTKDVSFMSKLSIPRWLIFPVTKVPFEGPEVTMRCFTIARNPSAVPAGDSDDIDPDDIPSLSLEPSLDNNLLPGIDALYLHVAPVLHVGKFSPEDLAQSSIGVLPFHLSEDGYKQFIQAVWDYSSTPYPNEPVPHRYNSRVTVETMRTDSLELTYLYSTFNVELVSVAGTKGLDSIIRDESIEKEIYLYQQIIRDYSRSNINKTIIWAMLLREDAAKLEPVPLAEAPSDPPPNVPTLDTEMLETLRAVQDGLLAHDKNEAVFEFQADRPDEDLKPHYVYSTLPVKYSEVPLCPNQYRIVVFDAVGIIVDRVSAIKSALSPFSGAVNSYHYDAAKLCKLYLEAEALLLRDAPPNEGLRSLVDRTLMHFVKQYGAQGTPGATGHALQDAAEHIFNPPAFADAIKSLQLLRDQNFKLLCIHPDDADIRRWVERIIPADLCPISSSGYPLHGLHFPAPDLYPQLLARCDDLEPGIQSAQIVLVTTGKARQIPYASEADIPTVLMRRETILESRVDLCIPGRTQNPTPSLYLLDVDLGTLGDKLGTAASAVVG
ncbi:hypothetical protein PYCCODRAFT_1479044 [Trametes coccinea BRFM310]|uniref:HAD-like protein n=1 Tax=Trametes coccinea (strain BRFM310) TaxID=1353009 RepID=A0A1Y2IHH2_TRAC3|nr:hypothetical protein PYCCODRAFT_1479044 [Trametes coccinea BRFM310]